MDDLVKRLRKAASDPRDYAQHLLPGEAADRIEELEAICKVGEGESWILDLSDLVKYKARVKELESDKKDILSAVKRMDYGYIESVYLGYDDDGNPPK